MAKGLPDFSKLLVHIKRTVESRTRSTIAFVVASIAAIVA